jgi:hypothetical protein
VDPRRDRVSHWSSMILVYNYNDVMTRFKGPRRISMPFPDTNSHTIDGAAMGCGSSQSMKR